MPYLFALTLFLGAVLLFWVQPLVAKMALPLLGGTPAVWNTCVVFFQAALLAGYGYAHLAPGWLGVRRQTILHLGVLLLPLAVLPIALPERAAAPTSGSPALWLLGLLAAGVGLPFFAVATTAPLLQRWFAGTGHPAARDPYFLYAASNLGSMLGLLGYPFALEPLAALDEQSWLWAGTYVALVVLIGACAAAVWLAPAKTPLSAEAAPDENAGPERITPGRRLKWVVLAAVPCSLMLSVTTYLTTDIAPVPLLWVVPLALYLLTFILAFSRRELVPLRVVGRAVPLVAVVLVLLLVSEATEPRWLLIGLHLAGLFALALYCHGRLARNRPDVRHLTEFYFWLSAGGVLGGACNTLLAPLVFNSVAEYPVALVLACLLRSPGTSRGAVDVWDALWPLGVGAVTVLLIRAGLSLRLQPGPVSVGFMFGPPLLFCYVLLYRPVSFGLGLAALLLASTLYPGIHGRAEFRARSFFGVHKVAVEPTGKYRRLIHGTTVHGQQSLGRLRQHEPLAYFHREGPVGKLFEFLYHRDSPPRNVAVVGLGAGSLAAYGQPGQHWTFYEIDPVVIYIARDSGYFTYLHDLRERGASLNVVTGDARLQLDRADADGGSRYDVLVIDAFSSDALPVHLFTREALAVYLRRLNEKGVLAFHISNGYLDMEPVLAALAADAGLACRSWFDPREDLEEGRFRSHWVAMARPGTPLPGPAPGSLWDAPRTDPDQPLWRDAHTNILGLLK